MDNPSHSQSSTPPRRPDDLRIRVRAKSTPNSTRRKSDLVPVFTHDTARKASLETELPQDYNGLFRSVDNTKMSHKQIRKITCLGSGFVGGPTSAVMAFKANVDVTVVDVNTDRIAAWQSNVLPIYEPGLHEIVQAARDCREVEYVGEGEGEGARTLDSRADMSSLSRGRLFFSTDTDRAINDADLIFVCVNTPAKAHGIGRDTAADLGFVEAATRAIANIAKDSKIVIEKSTVPCRTAQSIREILSANARSGVVFEVLSNPEFLAEGTAVRDLLYPDRVIIGSLPTPTGLKAAASLADIYAQWVPRERIITMNSWSSELSKLASNAMLAQRVSSVNALSVICEATGADVNEVSHACGLDSRIGPLMLNPGPGFGGSCFQKDIFNIVYLSESLHLREVADYWRSIISMNEYQKRRFTQRIIACLFNNLAGKKIAVLGFAFKKDTSDTRGSPAITLVRNFVAERAFVAIYDPKVQEEQIWKELVDDGGDLAELSTYVQVCKSAYTACEDGDAVVVVTEWDEFSNKTDPMLSGALAPSTILADIDPNRISTPKFPTSFNEKNLHSLQLTQNKYELKSYHEKFNTSLRATAADTGVCNTRRLDWRRVARGMRRPMYVFDGRNILDAAKLERLGFRVETIGKASTNLHFLGGYG